MLDLIKQRLKSKTYLAALLGLVLTWAESQSGLVLSWMPMEYKPYAVFIWPILMMTLREVTTGALADK